jgi:hypothetical protein
MQIGVQSANLAVFQTKTAALVPANQDEGLLEDASLAPRAAWTEDVQFQRGSRSATRS